MKLNDAPGPLFGADYAVWMDHQLALLRQHRFSELDVEHLLEELGGTLRSQHHELRHRLKVILVHLLKCQFQPARKGHSWCSTLDEQRESISEVLKESPSLRRLVAEYAESMYPSAVRRASGETGLSIKTFPGESPYTAEELLDPDFIP